MYKLRKQNIISRKIIHIDDILQKIISNVCSDLHYINWQYEKGSVYEKLDFYRWKINNFKCRLKYTVNNLSKEQKKRLDIQNIKKFIEYFEEFYKLFTESLNFRSCFSIGEYNFHKNWLKKNIKKFKQLI